MILLDVTPHALGIMTFGGYFEELIPQNTTVPTQPHEDLHDEPRQPDGREDPRHAGREQNAPTTTSSSASSSSPGLRRAPKGQVEIEVTFEINADGIVSVRAKDLETGQEQSIQVTASSGLTRGRDQEHDRGARRTTWSSAARPRSSRRAKQEAEKLIAEIERLFPQVEQIVASSDFGRDAIDKARAIVDKARQAIAKRDVAAVKSRSRGSRARTACSRASWPRRIEDLTQRSSP